MLKSAPFSSLLSVTSLIVALAGWGPDLAAAEGPAKHADAAADFPKQAILVRVVDEADQPVEGVRIHRSVWTKVRFPANADVVTDRQGEVNLIIPEQIDILRLWATKKSYVPLFVNFEKRAMKNAPMPQDFVFHLTRGTTVGGFVVDESGAPIAGAKVEVSVHGKDSRGTGEVVVARDLATGEEACSTDQRGFWSLDNVPAGNDQHLGLWLSHPDFVADMQWRGLSGKPPFTLAQLRAQKAQVTMEKGVKLSGTITDPDGKPVPLAMVVWGHRPYHNPRHQETFADKEGIYHLPPFSTTPTLLTIIAEGFAPQLKSFTPDSSAAVLDFQLRRGTTTQFRFKDAEGNQVPNVTVNIAGWRGEETLFNWRHPNVPYSLIPDQADKDGAWKWDWAPDDAVDYYFGAEGYQSGEKQSFGPGEHEIILHPKDAPTSPQALRRR